MAYEHSPFGESIADLQDDLASLKDDMNNLRRDLGELVRSVVDLGRSHVGDARERLQEQVQTRLGSIQDAVDDVRERSGRTISTIHRQIEERPLMTVGIAVGVGLLLGTMMQRR